MEIMNKEQVIQCLSNYDLLSYSECGDGKYADMGFARYPLNSLRKKILKDVIQQKLKQLVNKLEYDNFIVSLEEPDINIDIGYKDDLGVSMHSFLKIKIYGSNYNNRI